MKRHKPLNRVNRKRREKRRSEAFGPQAELCRTLPCCLCGLGPPSDPAHVRSRGAGGKDRCNVVPFCRSHHARQHSVGWSTLLEECGQTYAYIQSVCEALEAEAYGAPGGEPEGRQSLGPEKESQ